MQSSLILPKNNHMYYVYCIYLYIVFCIERTHACHDEKLNVCFLSCNEIRSGCTFNLQENVH